MTQRLIVLISGRGSNLAALGEGLQREGWPAQLCAVVSNRPQAAGLDWARQHGVPTEVIDHTAFGTRAEFDAALLQACQRLQPDLVVLAGFMRVLDTAFVEHFAGRLINIHPSLLPAFAGLHTHRRALQAGAKVAGATVHYVTAELDHGPIIAQAVVPVRPGDDEQRLSERVLQAEHRLLPMAVGWHLRGELSVQDGIVRHSNSQAQCLFCDEQP